MSDKKGLEHSIKAAADVVRDAGGRVVGRTRLQKIACLLEMMGLGAGFHFAYRHYGPYSDDLASSVQLATLLTDLDEIERRNTWGGNYSIFTDGRPSELDEDNVRRRVAEFVADCDPVELELAVTAAFLAANGEADPWLETEMRKPEKSSQRRLEKARALYARLLEFDTPKELPQI